jgi:hypothetical protein
MTHRRSVREITLTNFDRVNIMSDLLFCVLTIGTEPFELLDVRLQRVDERP